MKSCLCCGIPASDWEHSCSGCGEASWKEEPKEEPKLPLPKPPPMPKIKTTDEGW